MHIIDKKKTTLLRSIIQIKELMRLFNTNLKKLKEKGNERKLKKYKEIADYATDILPKFDQIFSGIEELEQALMKDDSSCDDTEKGLLYVYLLLLEISENYIKEIQKPENISMYAKHRGNAFLHGLSVFVGCCIAIASLPLWIILYPLGFYNYLDTLLCNTKTLNVFIHVEPKLVQNHHELLSVHGLFNSVYLNNTFHESQTYSPS